MDYIFEKGKFTEDELEHAIIELFEKQEYTYVPGESIHRQYEDILLLDDLRSFLSARYAQNRLSEVEMQKIINKLVMIQATQLYLGNREAFWLVNEGFDLVRDDISQVALHVDYIDFDHPENNIFKVVNQYSVQGERLRRPDLLVFINGIPIAICEFKTAIEEDTTIHDAWEQITIRYTRDIPKLMKYCFLSVISDGANTRLGSIFTPYKFYYSWNKANDTDKVSNGISSLLTMIEGAFAKDRVLQILRDFIFYPDDSKKEEAIVCRYPQFFGAHKMLDSVRDHMRPEGDGKGGTYFGATGCGKTYTMLFLSRLIALRDNDAFNNPTIVILEDREDLDTQTSELFVTAKKYLHQSDVRSIESREDMEKTLRDKPSGGVYITTIQKFCEKTGLLSDRSNIICISDEAHRTQTGVGAKLKKTDKGVFTTYGFAKYLRDSFPNATYCGFTGTPIDETIAVFGRVVDSYTMKESSDDGITVRIAYEPRLARVIVSDEQAKEIEKYYQQCAAEGSNPEQIEESKWAMSRMSAILGHPDRLKKLAADVVAHYESLCSEKPEVVQKAMIVCADRPLAFKVLKAIEAIRPEWFVKKKAEHEDQLTREQLDKLVALPMINMVATQGQNDEKELYDLCGTKEYRKMLDRQFKNNDSNFRIAVVVDMWITGFDVPSLAVMYIDKPLQKHTLIQTISRVNRVFDGKDRGLVVDYIGIKNDMMEAVKKYGGPQESPIDELNITLSIFRNHLALIDELLDGFNASKFFSGTPLVRLNCLNAAAEYVQLKKEMQTRFMGLSRRLKSAYMICFPSGELTDAETANAEEEDVSEIFVRVNSGGVALKQNDFILTLLSLYWDEGRKEIEQFSMESTYPSKDKITSYNQLTEVTAQDVIRVVMAYAFDRARLKYGYKLLRGADFDKKGAVDETLRDQRFDVLKAKLPDVLNVHNWHEFLKSIMNAGYLSGDLILSGNAIYYTYAFYLIAKYRFNASYNENMHLTSLWFFYASMVSLYTGSFESTVENHLNSIKELTTLEEYKRFILSRVVERLTNDYFDITLIGSEGLAVSGRGNNAWNAYVAALNILNAKILFSKSNLLVSKLFEPGTDGKRKSLEKHHLFPKAYLKTLGYNDAKINQMANYAFIDWKDNMEILDEAPAIYYPVVCEGRSPEEIQRMEEENALPHGWENMSYEDFLIERRKLMATKIKQAFEILKNNAN